MRRSARGACCSKRLPISTARRVPSPPPATSPSPQKNNCTVPNAAAAAAALSWAARPCVHERNWIVPSRVHESPAASQSMSGADRAAAPPLLPLPPASCDLPRSPRSAHAPPLLGTWCAQRPARRAPAARGGRRHAPGDERLHLRRGGDERAAVRVVRLVVGAQRGHVR